MPNGKPTRTYDGIVGNAVIVHDKKNNVIKSTAITYQGENADHPVPKIDVKNGAEPKVCFYIYNRAPGVEKYVRSIDGQQQDVVVAHNSSKGEYIVSALTAEAAQQVADGIPGLDSGMKSALSQNLPKAWQSLGARVGAGASAAIGM